MRTPEQDLLRDKLIQQEIDRLKSKLEHHEGRVHRGTADSEDAVAVALYTRIVKYLEGL